jgi:hypothetical protein
MFIMRSARAEKYRQEAARLRLEAERAKHPDIRRQLLNIATQYDDLANSVEPVTIKMPHHLSLVRLGAIR